MGKWLILFLCNIGFAEPSELKASENHLLYCYIKQKNMTIPELERKKDYKELSKILYRDGVIPHSHLFENKNAKVLTYKEFIQRTITILDENYNKLLKNDCERHLEDLKYISLLLIDAYNSVGGIGDPIFYDEKKFPNEGALTRLMFNPTIFFLTRELHINIQKYKIQNK